MIDRLNLKIKSYIHYLTHIGIYFGRNVKIYGKPKILYGNKIKIGSNVRINDDVFLHAVNGIELGNNVTLSYGASLITESYDLSSNDAYLKRKHSGAPITIGNNVWICANVTILPGVKIADDVIVAAGSVVNKNLDKPGSLYAGNPASFIKKRDLS